MSAATCPHANCGCPTEAAHTPYCSPYCANAAEQASLPGEADPEGACACDHEACRSAQEPSDAPHDVTTATG